LHVFDEHDAPFQAWDLAADDLGLAIGRGVQLPDDLGERQETVP